MGVYCLIASCLVVKRAYISVSLAFSTKADRHSVTGALQYHNQSEESFKHCEGIKFMQTTT